MELGGLEPPTFRLPAERSGQLSYSPVEIEVVSKVNACLLAVPRRGKPELDGRPVLRDRHRKQEAAIKLSDPCQERAFPI